MPPSLSSGGIDAVIGVAQRLGLLIHQGEFRLAGAGLRAFQEGLDFPRRATAQAEDAGGAVLAALAHRVGDLAAHHMHAGVDAFGHFQAQAMHQLLIDIARPPAPSHRPDS